MALAALGAAIAFWALSCGGGGGGTPTAPRPPEAPPPETTFQPVCSPTAADGSYICVADLRPVPGTRENPTVTRTLSVRLTGRTPPRVAGKVYEPIFVWGGENEPPELGYLAWPNTLLLESGEFETESTINIEMMDHGQAYVVCALLERKTPEGRQREQLIYSPWVEGYRMP